MNTKSLSYQNLSLSHYDARQKRILFIFAVIFLTLAIVIGVSGYVSFSRFERDYRQQAEHEISAVAELKMSELTVWRNERMGDANVFYHNPAFSSLVERYFNNPEDTEAKAQLLIWLSHYQVYGQYDRLRLLDALGAEKLSIPNTPESVDARLAIDVSKNLLSGEILGSHILYLHNIPFS